MYTISQDHIAGDTDPLDIILLVLILCTKVTKNLIILINTNLSLGIRLNR